MTYNDVKQTLELLYPSSVWPKPLHLLYGESLVRNGVPIGDAAKKVRTSAKRLQDVLDSNRPLHEVLGLDPPADPEQLDNWDRTVGILGQLLLGNIAERVFEQMFRDQMPNRELRLTDVREGRTDTDYRLLNGNNRPVYRLNIKFHGARFRRATELVGLDPEDSFALATYKIQGALKKQQEEQLPYFFAIVGVSNLTGAVVGRQIPKELLGVAAYLSAAPKMKGKRDLEDKVVAHLVSNEVRPFSEVSLRIKAADWYILSARRAYKLLTEKLFERVFALRIRDFSRVFGGAEIDMHFSLSEDLIPISDFFTTVREGGLHKITTMLERGDY